MRNPRRTAATASALMIGLGLVVFVAVFGASAKASTTAVLERTLKADFILTSPTLTGFSTSAAEDAARGARRRHGLAGPPGRGEGRGWDRLHDRARPGDLPRRLRGRRRPGRARRPGRSRTRSRSTRTSPANDGGPIGDTVTVEWPATGEVELEVAVIYAENGLIGDWVTSLDTYDANVAQELDLFVLIKADEGVGRRRGAVGPRDYASSRTRTSRSRTRPRSATCTRRSSTRC